MSLFKRKKKERVCVIGLDGVPISLIEELSRKGVMPAFAQLLKSGSLRQMKASLPEISAVSWTDFMTGTNSGSHGIFGFTDLKDNSYDLRFPNFSDVKIETFWDTLGDRDKKCIVINQPSTYPARQIHGALISGFVAIELSKAVFPPSLEKQLTNMDYKIDIDTQKSRSDHTFLWTELEAALRGRERAFDHFWKEDWNYFELIITGTDRLHHFLWNAYEDENHSYHQKFLDYYHQIDRFIDKIVTAYREINGTENGLYFLSDHGFAGISQEVFLNAWLEKQGYLEYESPSPNSLGEISSSTKAFAMDPNRIYINKKNKFPKGCVSPQESAELKAEIASQLEKLEYEGQKTVRKVFDTDVIYSGPFCPLGPDLIVLSESGFDMKGSVKQKDIFSRSSLEGMHTWDDAFFWADRDVNIDLCISDLSSIILSHFI